MQKIILKNNIGPYNNIHLNCHWYILLHMLPSTLEANCNMIFIYLLISLAEGNTDCHDIPATSHLIYSIILFSNSLTS